MDRWLLVLLLVASWSLNAFLLVKLLRSHRVLSDKIGGAVLLLIPLLGPLLCWLVYDPPPPQARCLQNRGPWGQYTHNWIGMKPVLEQILKERREKTDQTDQES
jgi:hypothetical protein